MINRQKKINLYWLIVIISYHRFNNLSELLNRDLTTQIGWGVLSKDLMYREYNCSLPSKVNVKCVYKFKLRSKCLIQESKCSMCEAIYIGNTQQKLKRIMDSHLSDLLRLLKNRQISDSFAAHF